MQCVKYNYFINFDHLYYLIKYILFESTYEYTINSFNIHLNLYSSYNFQILIIKYILETLRPITTLK